MKSTKEVFQNYNCLRLSNDEISVWLTTTFGLRLIGLTVAGDNLLADLPEAKIERSAGEDYWLRGGHRLWYAPEHPDTTYIPDNLPVETIINQASVEQIQPVDEATGIQKSWEIRLADGSAQVVINHRLSNQGETTRTLAPWAITMLRPGGVGILPQKTRPSDENGLLPNRHLVLWPYTPIHSEYIQWGDEAIFIEARMKADALKIGSPNPEGWLAYQVNGWLFIKKASFDPSVKYLDRGASSEIYCCPDFIELETLGPVVELTPGEIVEHQERWQLYPEGHWPKEIQNLYRDYRGLAG